MLNRKKTIINISLLVLLIGLSSCGNQSSENSVLTPAISTNVDASKTITLSSIVDISTLASGSDSDGNFLILVGTDSSIDNTGKTHILKSVDGGSTWSDGTTLVLNNASAFTTVKNDDKSMWIVGGEDSNAKFAMMTSTDEGKNWVTTDTPGGSIIKQLLGVNIGGGQAYVFAVNTEGDLYVSSDFTKTWRIVKTGMSYISAISEETLFGVTKLFIAGHDADETNDVILSSSDNGDTWGDPLYTQPMIGIISKIFAFTQGQKSMIVVSNDLGTRLSADNGKTWNLFDAKVGAPNSFVPGFKDHKSVIFTSGSGGENGTLSYSADFGNTWAPLLPTPGVGTVSEVVAIGNGDSSPSILVSGNLLSKVDNKFIVNGRLAISDDLGASWNHIYLPADIKNINAVSGLKINGIASIFVAVTYNDLKRSLIYSNDLGKTWIKKDLPMNSDSMIVTSVYAVNNLGKLVVFVATTDKDNSYLYRSDDIGSSWTNLNIGLGDSATKISEITAANNGSVLLVKVAGAILSSNDLGKSWVAHISTNSDILSNLLTISLIKLNGKIVLIGGLGISGFGNSSSSYISEDMGLTWSQPSWLSSVGSICSVYVTTNNHYYAVSAYGSYVTVFDFDVTGAKL